MATIRKETEIAADAAQVWDAVRDYGALHERLVPGFVASTELVSGAEPPVRIVTFANGVVLPETIVAVDDDARRLVWSVRAEGVAHHNGALQVFDDGPGRCRVVWTADVLPHALADEWGPLMAAGLERMAAHLGR
jgi:carbon monoxide dehydrogenase subunit G